MAEEPSYVILGRGYWAQRMQLILTGENRVVSRIEETRQRPTENASLYVSRLASAIQTSKATIAWLCVLPGPHVSHMIEAALEARAHVIVEKPWYGSQEDTERLQALARQNHRLLAVHFEYLALSEVEDWKTTFHPGLGLQFGSHFFQSRSGHTNIPALDNLGCHTLAIREFAVPASEIAELACGYQRADERLVWIERAGQRLSSIDLRTHGQPIIQRFLKKVEAAIEGAAFAFDLEFALRVQNQINTYRTAASPSE